MSIARQVHLDDLPPQARQMAELIGIQGLLALAEYRGGRWLYVPKDVGADHPLAKCVGIKKARALCRVFDGERVMMPACVDALRAIRDEEIFRRHYDDGMSLDALAGEYGISQRSVLRALARAKERAEMPEQRQVSML